MPLAAYPYILPSLRALLGEEAGDRNHDLLDLLPVGVYLCDCEGRVVDYNRAAVELWGRAPQRGDPVPYEEGPMAEVLATGKAKRDQEVVIERYDGTRLTALVSVEPIRDAKGRLLGAVNVFRDHTAQRQESKRLRRQRGKLSTVLQALPMAVYTTDAEGRITFYNEAAADLWGLRPELGADQFCGSLRFYWPDGTPLPHDECPMAMILKSRQAIRGKEAVLERPDGTRIPFLAYPTPLLDAKGNLTGAVNVLLDMRERNHAHEQLRSSEERYRAIFDNAQVSVWELDYSAILAFLDELRAGGVADLRVYLQAHPEIVRQALERLRVTGVNAYTLELFEAEDERSLLRNLEALFVPQTDSILIDLLVSLRQGQHRLEGETVLHSLKGRRLDVIVSIAFGGENASRSVVTVQDITQRKTAELAAQHLAAVVESSDDAILAMDLDGTITSWNLGAERLYGYAADEILGQPVALLIPAERRDDESIIIASIRNGRRVDHYETVRQRKDGSLVDVSLTVSPVEAPDGTIVGASKIARDITERSEAQQQQQLLLREMNHRIKNLLTLSSGLVSLSARFAQTPGELATAVQERLNALARAHEMILPSAVGAGNEHDRSTTLHALVRTIVSPYDAPSGDSPSRIRVGGCDIEIAGRAVTSFALLLHEFATNAAKYGALSIDTGHVEIDCADDGDNFVVVWKEVGGPPLADEADANGFGSVLSRATVKGQLRGELTKEWNPEGLMIRLSAPKERLLS
jgi:PAS domain S-box-containing protein